MNSVFTCPICLLKYNRLIRIPITLQCGHVICKVCIKNNTHSTCNVENLNSLHTQNLNSNNYIICGIDGQTVYFLDINSLPICYTILDHLPHQEMSDFFCANHQNKKIKYFCSYDNQNLCSKCLVLHAKNPHKVNKFFPQSKKNK